MIRQAKREKKNIWLRIVLAFAFLFSGSAVGTGFNSTMQIYLLLLLCSVVLITIVVKYKGVIPLPSRGISDNVPWITLILVTISIIYNLHTFSPLVSGRAVLTLLLAILLMSLFKGNEALEAYVDVMRFFAIVGIACWLIFIVLGAPYTWMPQVKMISSNSTFYSIGVYSIGIYGALGLSTRNAGFCWEPSIFSGYLMVALYVSFFLLKKNKRDVWIFIIAVLTTQSSGGIMMLASFFLCIIWGTSESVSRSKMFKRILITILIFVGIVEWGNIGKLLLEINYDLFYKIVNMKDDGSPMARVYSFVVDFQIWLKSPFFGVGPAKLELDFLDLRDIIAPTISNMSHCATTMEYIAAYGIGGIWINYHWAKGVLSLRLPGVIKVCFLATVGIFLNVVPQLGFAVTYFILFALLQFETFEELLDE